MDDSAKIPPSILDEDVADRFGRQLEAAGEIAARIDAEMTEARSEVGRIAAEARWHGHEAVHTTPLRVATHIVERIKKEIPKAERRAFVDDALLNALDLTRV